MVVFQVATWANDGDAVFIREYTLIRRDHLPEEPLHDVGQKPEDTVSGWEINTQRWLFLITAINHMPPSLFFPLEIRVKLKRQMKMNWPHKPLT